MISIKEIYQNNRYWVLMALIGLALFLLFLTPFLIWQDSITTYLNPESLKGFIEAYGKWAILVFMLVSIATIVSPPLPNDIVPAVGGLLFGFWTALLYSILARIIGSTINYWLGTKIRQGLYIKFISADDNQRLQNFTDRLGWQSVFISRFLPSADTDIIAYLAGVAKMHYRTFIIASFFGMLVPVAGTILIGVSIFKNKFLFFGLIAFYIFGMLFAPKIIKSVMKKKI